ncbi:zinc finger MYM-type protein 2-like [Mercenaria mercenaria]|uniref:zinc finger MYM-type protein 2-like n=1 Tax=Mercenaria mercenaria TaxID=6596 RepID=UPI00234F44E9|nr:zinc finger MYM-type protein 2-like [Mercenaria mercenaria]
MNAYKKWRRDVLSKESGKLSDLHALLKSKENILKMDNSELNFVLSCFFLAVRKENGEVYLPDTIHVFISGIQKHFQMNGRDVSFFIDTQFKGLKNCLENLLKERSKLGICLYKKQAKPITTEQEDKLWQSKLLGDETPRMLLNTMFWIIRIYFGLRGGQEHSNLALNNFKIGCDTDGRRFLQYTETMPKTNSRLKYRRVNPHCAKAYELIENPARCPVAIFQKYTSKLHPSSNPKKFYYNPIINGGLRGPWFTLVAVGHRQLNQVVKTIMHDAGYEGHYTNNSLRVTATRLTNAEVPDQLIMAQTGQCSSADGLVEIR